MCTRVSLIYFSINIFSVNHEEKCWYNTVNTVTITVRSLQELFLQKIYISSIARANQCTWEIGCKFHAELDIKMEARSFITSKDLHLEMKLTLLFFLFSLLVITVDARSRTRGGSYVN